MESLDLMIFSSFISNKTRWMSQRALSTKNWEHWLEANYSVILPSSFVKARQFKPIRFSSVDPPISRRCSHMR